MRWLSVGIVAMVVAGSACGRGATEAPARTAAAHVPPPISPYEPSIDPADFVTTVDNPFFPLEPGTTYRYKGTAEGEAETDIVTVTTETKDVMGVTCVVVKDVVSSKGKVAEKTFDWYAQDRSGNVWYFGEDSTEYENGHPGSTKGSWEGGVDGALPGIIMLAEPRLGDRYRQEYDAGNAEDIGMVIQLGANAAVPFGSFDNVLVTEDSSLIETKLLENKYYARGVGVVLERSTKGPDEVVKLVDLSHAPN